MVRLALAGDDGRLDAWLDSRGFVPCEAVISSDAEVRWLRSVDDRPGEPVLWLRPGGDLTWAQRCWALGARWVVGGCWSTRTAEVERALALASHSPSAAWLSFVMCDDSLDIDKGCTLLSELLERDDWGETKERGRLRTVAQEALTNAWEHGHEGDRSRPVEVLFSLSEGNLTLEVLDQGTGFELEQVPDPMSPENILNESGRGIYIMRTFLDDLTYQDSGRHLIGRKRL